MANLESLNAQLIKQNISFEEINSIKSSSHRTAQTFDKLYSKLGWKK